ncbi:MAG TPA: hypothetical protein VGF55_30305, partial [Gemmataceae bacterium]
GRAAAGCGWGEEKTGRQKADRRRSTTATTTTRTTFRGQYRPPGSTRWLTFCEQPTDAIFRDELLTTTGLAGMDLLVTRVERREPMTQQTA